MDTTQMTTEEIASERAEYKRRVDEATNPVERELARQEFTRLNRELYARWAEEIGSKMSVDSVDVAKIKEANDALLRDCGDFLAEFLGGGAKDDDPDMWGRAEAIMARLGDVGKPALRAIPAAVIGRLASIETDLASSIPMLAPIHATTFKGNHELGTILRLLRRAQSTVRAVLQEHGSDLLSCQDRNEAEEANDR